MRYSAFAFSVILLAVIPTTVFAQTASTTTTNTNAAAYQTAPFIAPGASGAGTIRQTIQTARQNFQDQMATAKQAFMQKLQLIKDTRKQQIVITINDKIPQINTRETDRMKKVLDNLNTTLGRISSRAADLKSSGKDTTAVDSAIAAAQTAITTANTAVTTQAGKQYTITITSEQTLRTTIAPTITQLRQDLITTQTTVKNARLAVIKAYQALLAASGVTPSVNPSTTASPSAASLPTPTM